MKKFVLGMLVGGAIAFFWMQAGSSDHEYVLVKKTVAEERKQDDVIPSPVVVVKKPQGDHVARAPRVMRVRAEKASVVETLEIQKEPSKTLNLNLNRLSVDLLESAWDELPDHASSERIDGGWKIRLKRKDRLFSRLGFKDGDVIDYESLDTDALSDGQYELIQRVVAILRHIED